MESLKDYDGKSASHRGGSDSSDDIEIDADAEEDSSGNCEYWIQIIATLAGKTKTFNL